MDKIELVRTKKSNRVAIYTTDPEGCESLLALITDWVRKHNLHYGYDAAKVVRRDSIHVRENSHEPKSET